MPSRPPPITLQVPNHCTGLDYNMPLQSWARDNTTATTWPGFQATNLFFIALLLYSLWLLHLDTEKLIFFEFFLVPEVLLRCCCREAKQMSRAQLCLYLHVGWPWLCACVSSYCEGTDHSLPILGTHRNSFRGRPMSAPPGNKVAGRCCQDTELLPQSPNSPRWAHQRLIFFIPFT